MRFLGFLLLVGFVCAYFSWILTAVIVVAAVMYGRHWWDTECERTAQLRAEHQAIAKRADQQHSWTLAGNPRGTYGRYPPATI